MTTHSVHCQLSGALDPGKIFHFGLKSVRWTRCVRRLGHATSHLKMWRSGLTTVFMLQKCDCYSTTFSRNIRADHETHKPWQLLRPMCLVIPCGSDFKEWLLQYKRLVMCAPWASLVWNNLKCAWTCCRRVQLMSLARHWSSDADSMNISSYRKTKILGVIFFKALALSWCIFYL